jgi:hypothetical protein
MLHAVTYGSDMIIASKLFHDGQQSDFFLGVGIGFEECFCCVSLLSFDTSLSVWLHCYALVAYHIRFVTLITSPWSSVLMR